MNPRIVEIRKGILKKNDQLAAGLRQRFAAAQAQGGTVPEQIAAIARGVGDIFQVAGSSWNILLEFWAKAKTEPEVAASMVGTLRRYQAMFEALLQRGVSEGSLQAGDTGLLSPWLSMWGANIVLGVIAAALLVLNHREAAFDPLDPAHY
ncbi:MAG TPA: hypothetical protein PKZ53_17950, partial [Acidobacteriota bacterium]|nr:hypothetical protein [Acidobacteriota bacterium]